MREWPDFRRLEIFQLGVLSAFGAGAILWMVTVLRRVTETLRPTSPTLVKTGRETGPALLA